MHLTGNNSRSNGGSSKLLDVGRPRTRPPTESIALGFKAEPRLVTALDEEAARMTAERPAGSAKISRTEVIKVILYRWLDARERQ